jgi:hypothetical protein
LGTSTPGELPYIVSERILVKEAKGERKERDDKAPYIKADED